MEFNITDLISSVGFPIVCCIYMMTTNTKIVKENTDTLKGLQAVIEKLVTKIGE